MGSSALDDFLDINNYPDVWDEFHSYVSRQLNTDGLIFQFKSVVRVHSRDLDDIHYSLSLRVERKQLLTGNMNWHIYQQSSPFSAYGERTTTPCVYIFPNEGVDAKIINNSLLPYEKYIKKIESKIDLEYIYIDLFFDSESVRKNYYNELRLCPIISVNLQLSATGNADQRVDFYNKTFLNRNKEFVRFYMNMAVDFMKSELQDLRDNSNLFPKEKDSNSTFAGMIILGGFNSTKERNKIIFNKMSQEFYDVKAQLKYDIETVKMEIEKGLRKGNHPVKINDGLYSIGMFMESDYMDDEYDDLLTMINPNWEDLVEIYKIELKKLQQIKKESEMNAL